MKQDSFRLNSQSEAKVKDKLNEEVIGRDKLPDLASAGIFKGAIEKANLNDFQLPEYQTPQFANPYLQEEEKKDPAQKPVSNLLKADFENPSAS